jgi:hypothetical protein
MLNAKCMICTCVNALVISCQYAPSLTPGSHVPFGAAAQAALWWRSPLKPTAHSPLGRSASSRRGGCRRRRWP